MNNTLKETLQGLAVVGAMTSGSLSYQYANTGVEYGKEHLSPDVSARIATLEQEFKDRCHCVYEKGASQCLGNTTAEIIRERDFALAKDGFVQDLRPVHGNDVFWPRNPGWSELDCTTVDYYVPGRN